MNHLNKKTPVDSKLRSKITSLTDEARKVRPEDRTWRQDRLLEEEESEELTMRYFDHLCEIMNAHQLACWFLTILTKKKIFVLHA